MQVRGYSRTSSYVYNWHLGILKLYFGFIMMNPIKTWFFELIEDAIGSKAMKQFKKEEDEKKDLDLKKRPKENS